MPVLTRAFACLVTFALIALAANHPAAAQVINIDIQNGTTVLTETGLAAAPDPQETDAYWNAPSQMETNDVLLFSDGETFAGTISTPPGNINNNDGSSIIFPSDVYDPPGNESTPANFDITNFMLEDYIFTADVFEIVFASLSPGLYDVYGYTPGDVGDFGVFGVGIAAGSFADLASARAAGQSAYPTTLNPSSYIQGEHYALLEEVAVPSSGDLTISFYNADDPSNLGVLSGMQLVRTGDLSDSSPGDFNDDGVVDAADYAVWRNNLNTNDPLSGNGDETDVSAGVVDSADYDLWRANYGATYASTPAATATPEPAAATALSCFLAGLGLLGRLRSTGVASVQGP